jgi:thioredoxin-like negative regulator of GroEL
MKNLQATTAAKGAAASAASAAPVLLEFLAPWCASCLKTDALAEAVAAAAGGGASLIRVNIDRTEWLGRRYQVDVIPTMLIFVNGRPVDRLTGVVSAAEIAAALSDAAKFAGAAPQGVL